LVEPRRSLPLLIFAWLLVAAAAVGVFLSWVWLELAVCGEYEADCDRRPDGERALAAAALGLTAFCGAVVQLHRRRKGAVALIALGFVFFAAAAILEDAALSGWDDLHLVP
jgi:hypothetical protein